ncbi:hypothetical protein PIROE2DRAFT_14178, partial [Piromyces sp. E2]
IEEIEGQLKKEREFVISNNDKGMSFLIEFHVNTEYLMVVAIDKKTNNVYKSLFTLSELHKMDRYFKFFNSPKDIVIDIYELYMKKAILLNCDKQPLIFLSLKWQFNSKNLETKIKIVGKEINHEHRINQLSNKVEELSKIVSQLQIELKEKDMKLYNFINYSDLDTNIFSEFSQYVFILNQIRYSTNRNPLYLNLLYRATMHGDTLSDIQDLVYNEDNIVVLIRNEEGYAFGGYTSYHFEKCDSYDDIIVTDNTAFLFNIYNSTVFPIKKKKNALRYSREKVFIFGDSDIIVNNNFIRGYYYGGSSVPYSYNYSGKNYPECFCGNETYKIEELEVFQCIFSS